MRKILLPLLLLAFFGVLAFSFSKPVLAVGSCSMPGGADTCSWRCPTDYEPTAGSSCTYNDSTGNCEGSGNCSAVAGTPTCREQCIASGNTPGECSGLPSCDEPAPPGVTPSCREQCIASGGSPSECNSLPSCSEPVGGSTVIPGVDLPEKVDCVETGLGCIPTDPKELAGFVLNLGIGLGTLLAVLFLIIGGFGVATSAGNPDNLEAAKKQITAAIAGLLFILMSVMILSIIGGGVIGIDFFK